jgi:hypothetical protein
VGDFSLVYVVFNTFFALTTQDAQVRCFDNVAAHLPVGGLFVIEAFVPDLGRFRRNQHVGAHFVGLERLTLDVSTHDPVTQTITTQQVRIGSDGDVTMHPVFLRYAWPTELDLMARLAGLRLRDRWSTWTGAPFTADSGFHISIYEKPAPHPADRRRR